MEPARSSRRALLSRGKRRRHGDRPERDLEFVGDELLPSTLFDGRAIRLRDGLLGILNHIKDLRPYPAVSLRGSLDIAGVPQR